MRLRYFLILILFALAFAPVAFFGAGSTSAVFSTDLGDVDESVLRTFSEKENARNTSILVLALGLSGAFLLALLVSIFSSRPLEQISAAARRIAEGEIYDSLNLKSPRFLPRELRDLHDSFHDMVVRLRDSMSQINQLAFSDSLTDLANREAFRRYLTKQIDKKDSSGTLLFIDLDGFKSINDTKGHDIGDAVLVDVAKKIRGLLDLPHRQSAPRDFVAPFDCESSEPIIARLGGDEFAVFLPGKSPQIAQAFADSILHALSKPMLIQNQKCRVGASIGIASLPDHGKTFSDLLKAADLAMYEAKRVGKNQVCHYSDEIAKSHDTLSRMAPELAEGFASGQFDVHFQPVYDAQSFALCSVEALLRWHHPTLGLLEAENFLDSAVQFGFQRQIDLFAIEQSLAITTDLVMRRAKLPAISVNIWAECLLNSDFVESIIERVPYFPCPLSVELVNTNASDARIVWAIDRLRESGVGIELDDFGIDATPIAALTEFRSTGIKIHRKLISQVHQSPTGAKLVASIIKMAHAQGAHVTAEGITTLDQVKTLQSLECDFLQGFGLNEPMTRDELFSYLTDTSDTQPSLVKHISRS